MIQLTTFATEEFVPAQMALAGSALECGARRISMWRPEDLKKTSFFEEHRRILEEPRGGGLWLWKPYFILRDLESVSEGDFVIYYDCGKPHKPHRIRRPLEKLTDWCHDNVGGTLPGVYIPASGRNARWIKGECFRVMGCDSDYYRDQPQIQATFSVWQRHEASLAFVREWLQWCMVPAAILDERVQPSVTDAPDFIDHRHDQAILTLLALKRGLKCFGLPSEGHAGSKGIDELIDRIEGRLQATSFEWKLNARGTVHEGAARERRGSAVARAKS